MATKTSIRHLTPAGKMYHLSLTIIRDFLEEMVINKLKLRSSLTIRMSLIRIDTNSSKFVSKRCWN